MPPPPEDGCVDAAMTLLELELAVSSCMLDLRRGGGAASVYEPSREPRPLAALLLPLRERLCPGASAVPRADVVRSRVGELRE